MWLDKLNQFKKESGKTIRQVSEESGIPVGTLNKLFSGQTQNPKLDTVREVVHALGHTLDELFSSPLGQGEKSPQTEGEEKLLGFYRALNAEGQEKLIVYAKDLTRTGDYKKVGSFWMGSKEA